MTKIIFFFYILFYLNLFGQAKTSEAQSDIAFYNATNKWFSAWKLVSKNIYKIDKVKTVDFVFFDDQYVYSTSAITIKEGDYVKGCNLMNLHLKWKKTLHNNSLTLPDKSVVPINLMSFAGAIPNQNLSFFVMPLPNFWEKSGVKSEELGLENLITGVFIHEFSHSQQMENFGRKITQFEKENNFGIDFSDDLIQNLFDKDSTYVTYYKAEVKLFYEAVNKNNLDRKKLKEGLNIMQNRQQEFFKNQKSNLEQIDDFFLTMEGLGQYSMFLWLIHPKGGNLNHEIAIKGVRRGGKWWSQDEGFALFLILGKLESPSIWAKNMFGRKEDNLIFLIDKLLH